MNKYFSIVAFIPVFFLLIYIPVFSNTIFCQNEDLDKLVLQKQVNYASDAAVDALLFSDDLEKDSANDSFTISPDIGVREFCTIMAESLGYTATDEVLEMLQNEYMQTLLVCAYDGVYAYSNRQSDDDGSREFVASPKLPYYYTKNAGTESQVQYLLTLGKQKGYKDSYNAANHKYKLCTYGNVGLSKDEQSTAINNFVSTLLQYELVQYAGLDAGKTYSVPAFASEINGAQPVQNVSVLAVLNTGDSRSNAVLGIGGSYIEETDAIVGFTHNGVKYYAPQSKVAKSSTYNKVTIEREFDSIYDAARSGYHCCLELYE